MRRVALVSRFSLDALPSFPVNGNLVRKRDFGAKIVD